MRLFTTISILALLTLSSADLQQVSNAYSYGTFIQDSTQYNGYEFINGQVAFNKDTGDVISIDYRETCLTAVHRNSENEFWCYHNHEMRQLEIDQDFKVKIKGRHDTLDEYKEIFQQGDLLILVKNSLTGISRVKVFNSKERSFIHERGIQLNLLNVGLGPTITSVAAGKHGALIGVSFIDGFFQIDENYFHMKWEGIGAEQVDVGLGFTLDKCYYVEKYDFLLDNMPLALYDEANEKILNVSNFNEVSVQYDDDIFTMGNETLQEFQLLQLTFEAGEVDFKEYGPVYDISFGGYPIGASLVEEEKIILVDSRGYNSFLLDVEGEKIEKVGGGIAPSLQFKNGSIVHFMLNGYIVENPDGTFANGQTMSIDDFRMTYFMDQENENLWYGQALPQLQNGGIFNLSVNVIIFDADSSTITNTYFDGYYDPFTTFQRHEDGKEYSYSYQYCKHTQHHYVFYHSRYNFSNYAIDVEDCIPDNYLAFTYNDTTKLLTVVTQYGYNKQTDPVEIHYYDLSQDPPVNSSQTTTWTHSVQIFKNRFIVALDNDTTSVHVYDSATREVIQTINTGKTDIWHPFVVVDFDVSKYPNIVGGIAVQNIDTNLVQLNDANGSEVDLGYPVQYSSPNIEEYVLYAPEVQTAGLGKFRVDCSQCILNLERIYSYTRQQSQEEEVVLEVNDSFLSYI